MCVCVCVCCVFFCFQAEDGIRDLVRSRGLGDVYKRQADQFGYGIQIHGNATVGNPADTMTAVHDQLGMDSVSYTHLTLPTSDLV